MNKDYGWWKTATTIPLSILPAFPKMPVFVIGNGISARHYDLNRLKHRGLILGCNKLFTKYDFSDCPFFLGAQDLYVCRMLAKTEAWKKIHVVTSEKQAVIMRNEGVTNFLYLDVKDIVCPDGGKPKYSTGELMLKFALLKNFFPIFIMGMGDKFETVDGRPTDNVFSSERCGDSESGYRQYVETHKTTKDIHTTLIAQLDTQNKWRSKLRAFYYGNEDKMFKVGDGGLEEMKKVEFDDIIKTLPAKWYTKNIQVEGITVRFPHEATKLSQQRTVSATSIGSAT